MSNLVSLSTLREDIRERMQLPAFTTTTAVTLSAVNRLINKALRSYAGLRAELYGDGYETARADLTTTANVATNSLPVGAQNVQALYWLRTTTDPVPIKRAQVDGYAQLYRGAEAWSAPRYRLEGATIVWLPIPNAAYDVRLVYTKPPPDLSLDGDTFDAGYEGDEWVAAHVCIRLAQREKRDDDIARYTAYLAQCDQSIRAHAAQRSETDAPTIRDAIGAGALGNQSMRDLATLDPWFGYR